MSWRHLLGYSTWESFRQALTAIRTHKMRAFLTLLGVMIGVMTIISTTTVLGGIRYRVTSVMENSLATNVFQVQQHDDNQGIHMGPNRRDRRPKLVPELADAIKERCPAVKAVGVETWEFGWTLERGSLKSNPNQQIAGGSIEFAKNNGYNVAMGRPITQQDIDANRHVMVMGWNAYKKLFDRMNPIGEFVKLKGEKFEIIGVFEERGSVMGESLDNDNWMPLPIWQRMYGTRRSVNLTVQAWNTALYDEAQEEVIEALRSERGLKPGEKNNFAMWTPDSRRQSFDKISQAIGLAAFGICGISLLVAGIGIMNIMLVSVTERTREIGLRKALGGTKASILRQFLIEAFMLSQVGGLIGILLGYFIAVFINQFLKFPAPIPMWSVTLSIIFCSVIGIGFGMWPAIRAARLDPIDALRYE